MAFGKNSSLVSVDYTFEIWTRGVEDVGFVGDGVPRLGGGGVSYGRGGRGVGRVRVG